MLKSKLDKRRKARLDAKYPNEILITEQRDGAERYLIPCDSEKECLDVNDNGDEVVVGVYVLSRKIRIKRSVKIAVEDVIDD
jgi:hypothetical protein